MIGINGTNGGQGRNGARRTLNVGVVGLGYWGPNLLRVLGRDARGEGQVDLRPGRAAPPSDSSTAIPATARTTNVDLLFEDPEVDAIFIATPVFTHFDLASRSLEAGKHTFVEKPLAPSAELASELLRRARERERVLMCGHTFLYSPPVRVVKDLLGGTSWARSSSSPRAG